MTELSPRETEVARLWAEGLTAREIGRRLGISKRTVEWHIANTVRKLNLRNSRQLAARFAPAATP